MTRQRRNKSLGLACVIAAVCSLGARPQCDVRTTGPPCDGPRVIVEPGTCTEIVHPCGGDWSELVTLSFESSPGGLWFEVRRRPTGTRVFVCAADTVGVTIDDPAAFRITDGSGDMTDVGIEVTTIVPLSAYVTAVPETVTAMDTLQLTAHGIGGIPPYGYEWRLICDAGDAIGVKTQESVVVYGSCDEYGLLVYDSFGGKILKRFSIPTYAAPTVTAAADVIPPGGETLLRATLVGGEMVERFWWVPTTGLDDPNVYATLARPATTTNYTFHVVTERGLHSSASALVTVQE